MPHLAKKSLHFSLLNGGPLSVSITSGTPNCLKWEQRYVMTAVKSLEVGFLIFRKPEYRSHTAAKSRPSWWKKSMQISWKGWVGVSAGMASSLCWDGAISLHVRLWLLFWEIAAPILGQKNLALAEAFMLFLPWWAECRQSSTSPLSSEGMYIWSSFIGTPSSVYSSSLIGQNGFRSSSTSARFSGKPDRMVAFSLTHVSSVTALSLTRSQVMALNSLVCHLLTAIMLKASSNSSTSSLSGSLEPWYLDVASGPLFLSPGTCITSNLYMSVLSFMALTRGFLTSSRFLVPMIETKGLWSVPRVRSGLPNVNILVDSRAYAKVSASPSTGL